MGGEGRRSREDRLKLEFSGTRVSSSTDFTILIKLLYLQSKNYSKSDGNYPPYSLCAIPMIFSALRCLMIEYESVSPPNRTTLKVLTEPNDFLKMLDYYRVTGQLLKKANLSNEIRNEIVHPARLPTGTSDNWPEYLQEIKKMGLLQSTSKGEGDYDFFSQMSSHKLFTWACRVAQDIAAGIVKSDSEKFKIKGMFIINFQEIII